MLARVSRQPHAVLILSARWSQARTWWAPAPAGRRRLMLPQHLGKLMLRWRARESLESQKQAFPLLPHRCRQTSASPSQNRPHRPIGSRRAIAEADTVTGQAEGGAKRVSRRMTSREAGSDGKFDP